MPSRARDAGGIAVTEMKIVARDKARTEPLRFLLMLASMSFRPLQAELAKVLKADADLR